MIRFVSTQIHKIIVHQVGNKSLDEGVVLSEQELATEDQLLKEILLKYFLSSFTGAELFTFTHEAEIDLNPMHVYASRIFSRGNNFLKQSENITKHLYECSVHPKVKSGDVYVAYFKGIEVENESVDAVGIFKSESSETFIKVNRKKNSLVVQYDQGASISKLDKGCLIFNTSSGLKVSLVDAVNRSGEAQYWKEDFLKIKPLQNEYYQTSEYLSATRTFVQEQFKSEFVSTKAEQIDLLNRSIEYFKSNDTFTKREFEKEVLQDQEVIKSFRKFNEAYQEEHEVEFNDRFEISTPAVKSQARKMKSVLKLDRNFHIYIHGDRNLIEQGVDKDGRKFYKIYFEKEL